MSTSLILNVNGRSYPVTVNNPDMPLLWVLRDLIGLTGTKYGCGIEICGACTVLVNGRPEKSCDMNVSSAAGKMITTVEGLSADRSHPLQKAWVANQVPQCGYCQSCMLMAAAGALNAGQHGAAIASEMHNICVCGTYQRIKQAVAGL